MADDTLVKDRSKRLFNYLRELSELRMKIVRTMDSYDETIWFADIPREPGCQSIDWTRPDEEADAWIEVHKPRMLAPINIPDALEPWVEVDTWRDSSEESPSLKAEILIEDEEGETVVEALEDHQEVQDSWRQCVEERWNPWAIEDRKRRRVQDTYNQLFSIYQRQQRLGETYEVVVGVGLLDWQTAAGKSIHRHLITAQASLDFEAARGIITVGPGSEGARIVLEQDMLEPTERPNLDIQEMAEDLIGQMEDDLLDTTRLETVLKSWVQSVSPQGIYRNDPIPENESPEDPCVRLAPALILRARTERSFIRLFKEIAENIDATGVVPLGVERLVSIADDEGRGGGVGVGAGEEEDIFFPLPTNPEQLEIAEKLTHRQGVLVQGPPGTGKSHSIANLICHLLAAGQRVLITSHTARALTVLKKKIPEEVTALCVSLLGNDRAALQALEDSVQEITDRYNTWNPTGNQTEIQRLMSEIDTLKQATEKTQQDLRSLREQETYKHPPMFGNYEGTMQNIALRVQAEKSQLGWVDDQPEEDQEVPLESDKPLRLLNLLREIDPKSEADALKSVIAQENLPEPDRFGLLVRVEKKAQDQFDEADDLRNHPAYASLKTAERDLRQGLCGRLDHLLTHIQNLKRDAQVQPWLDRAIQEILSEQHSPWDTLAQISRERLDKVGGISAGTNRIEVEGLTEDRSLKTVLAHAEDLLYHLEAGGKLRTLGLFLTKPAREAEYLVKNMRVDGRLCDNLETLQALISWIKVSEGLQELTDNWAHCEVANTGQTLQLQLAGWRDRLDFLLRALELRHHLQHVKMAFALLPHFPEPAWQDLDAVGLLKKVADAVTLGEDLQEARTVFEELDTSIKAILSTPNAHECMPRLDACVAGRDVEAYGEIYQTVVSSHALRAKIQERNGLVAKMRWVAPNTMQSLQETSKEHIWDTRLADFQEAWNFARVEKWLEDRNQPDALSRFLRKLEDTQERLHRHMGELVAAKSWRACFESLTEAQRQHLMAWVAAVRRIGKGTGKHAHRHRKTAQTSMEHCRSAIPAWIMPIYLVAETMKPQPDLFDVVIVDEASQSGPEALFLMYLAKKIVVVGDDRQISPESVGINRDDVELLRKRHIGDIEFSGSLGVDNSLFDQAKIRYGGRIRLREHYRCMPEIIQYCNNLCYASEPLEPLRQFGADRLEPIKVHYVSGGYMEGSRNSINKPEAEELVSQIIACCQDEAYKGKTMGVISLLGNAQARHIEHLLVEKMGPEAMEERLLFCGDAYAFQGDERDVMFLSMVSAPTEGRRIGTLSSDAAQRRFNVAVSRAKDQLWLFHSATENDLSPNCLRYGLLQYCRNPSVQPSELEGVDIDKLRTDAGGVSRSHLSPPEPFDSWFEVDVFLPLIDRGFRVLPQYKVVGYHIDLVVEGLNGKLAIECDGDQWHGPERYDADMTRQRQLERCGWTFWRVRGSTFYRDPSLALEDLWQTLERLGIEPGRGEIEISDGDEYDEVAEVEIEVSADEYDEVVEVEIEIVEADGSDIVEIEQGEEDEAAQFELLPEVEVDAQTDDEDDVQDQVSPFVPYTHWDIQTLPHAWRMPKGDIGKVFLDIIKVEGPIVCRRVYALYAKAGNSNRIPNAHRGLFNDVMASLVADGTLKQRPEYSSLGQPYQVVYIPDQQTTKLRERGEREVRDILPGEIALFLNRINAGLQDGDTEDAFQQMLKQYDVAKDSDMDDAWEVFQAAQRLRA